MANFKRIKLRATVESPPILLTEEQVDAALGALRGNLTQLDLDVLSIESAEQAPTDEVDSSDTEPWSLRGEPLN